jgi:hypothetical protein
MAGLGVAARRRRPEALVGELVAKLEDEYTVERLLKLTESGGHAATS